METTQYQDLMKSVKERLEAVLESLDELHEAIDQAERPNGSLQTDFAAIKGYANEANKPLVTAYRHADFAIASSHCKP